jgi:hypothetical protein
LRGWAPWSDRVGSLRKCASVPSGWCSSMPSTTRPSGWRSRRSPRRSGAQPRPSATGCRRPSGMPASAQARRWTSGRGSSSSSARTSSSGGERDSAARVRLFREGGARPPSEVKVGFVDAHRAGSRGRADLCADHPILILRPHGTRPRSHAPTGPGPPRPQPGRAHRPGVARASGSVRGPKDLEAAAAGGQCLPLPVAHAAALRIYRIGVLASGATTDDMVTPQPRLHPPARSAVDFARSATVR